MFRRANSKWDKFSGKFGFPGGHIKDNEDPKTAAVRETFEETGLKLFNPTYVKTYKFDGNIICVFAEELTNVDGIKLNHEHTEYKLFNPEDLESDKSIIPTCKYMYEDYIEKAGKKEVEPHINENRTYNKIIITENQLKKLLKSQKNLELIYEAGGLKIGGVVYDIVKTGGGTVYASKEGIMVHNNKLLPWESVKKLLLKYDTEL